MRNQSPGDPPKPRRRGAFGLLARVAMLLSTLLVAAACSSATGDSPTEPGAAGLGDDVTGDVGGFDETVEPDWAGAPINPFDLRVGDCYNEVTWIDADEKRRINITAKIDCSQPHDREVYLDAEFPAPQNAPFPGDVKMSEWSTELCYEAFSDFVGIDYELSQYGLDFLQPTKDTFEHPVGRHRRVTCSLFETSGEELTGSAADTAL